LARSTKLQYVRPWRNPLPANEVLGALHDGVNGWRHAGLAGMVGVAFD